MEEKYLPVGSVCMLKGGTKRVMVIGYAIQPKDDANKLYDYLGALYPEGIVSMDKNMVFNHDNIERVEFKGYETEEQKTFINQIKVAIENIKSGNNNSSPEQQVVPTINQENSSVLSPNQATVSQQLMASSSPEMLEQGQSIEKADYVPPFVQGDN